MSYSVSQRTREFGIRIALGAQPGQVRTLVLSETLTLAVLGGLGGIAGAAWLTTYLKTMLYGVSVMDDSTFVAAAVVLVAVAFVASLIPAHRASQVDPMVALREE
jgi:ABC-type antimicrobial peptide transport system permease subunit